MEKEEEESLTFSTFHNYATFILRVLTSNTTAATNTNPRIMYCQLMPTPIKFIPFVREAITKAPVIAPVTLPTPPAALAALQNLTKSV